MRRVAAKATLACGLLLSGSSAPEVLPHGLSEARQTEMQVTFMALRQYWLAKGVGLHALQLQILTGKDIAPCTFDGAGDPVTAKDPFDIYCKDQKTIVVTQRETRAIDYGLQHQHIPEANIASDTLVIAHEMGHGVQDAEGTLQGVSTFKQQRVNELDADCLAGEAVSHVNPSVVSSAFPFYRSLGSFPSHGTYEERFQHFEMSQHGQQC